MKILYVTKNIIDVFVGDEWKNWTRFHIVKKVGHPTFFKKLGGSNLDSSSFDLLRKEFK